jgi:hypothetical protein
MANSDFMNLLGGRDQDFQYTNLTDFGLNFDFAKLLGLLLYVTL